VTAKQILVVDDEPEIAEVVVYLLQSEGYAASYAPNAALAVQKVQQTQPALVLTDYMMPGMDGRELLQTLRMRQETASVPVVMLSALPEEVVRAKVERVNGFIQNPFKAEQLLRTVQAILDPP
jgi:CheY-like chemotaxis protein